MISYYAAYIPKQDGIKYFLLSSSLHIFVAIALFVTTLTLSSFFSDKKIDLTLIETSIKVDVVAMPTMTLKELKILSQDSSEWTKIEKKDTAVQEKKSFLDTLKKLSSKKIKKVKLKAEKNQRGKVSNKTNKKLKALIAAGNKLSKGSNLTGTRNSEEQGTLISNYADKIINIIKPFWILPSYLLNNNLKCKIRVFINGQGELSNIEIYKSSGVKEYDEQAIRSIKQSAPFPKTPEEIKNSLAKGTIILGFPL